MSFGIGIGDIISITTLAWDTFTALKSAPEEFEGIKMEVLSLSMTLQTLSDEAEMPYSILRRATPQKKENLRLLLENTTNGLSELRSLVDRCSSLGNFERRHFFERVDFARKGKQALRDRLAIHTSSLNMLLTSLTHGSLGRMEQLIASSALGMNSAATGSTQGSMQSGTRGTSKSSTLSAVERDLASEGVDMANLSQFQDEIRDYIRHLANGGRSIPWAQFQGPRSAASRTGIPQSRVGQDPVAAPQAATYSLYEDVEEPRPAGLSTENPQSRVDQYPVVAAPQAATYSLYEDVEEIVIDVGENPTPEADPVEDLVANFDGIFSVDEGFVSPRDHTIMMGPGSAPSVPVQLPPVVIHQSRP